MILHVNIFPSKKKGREGGDPFALGKSIPTNPDAGNTSSSDAGDRGRMRCSLTQGPGPPVEVSPRPICGPVCPQLGRTGREGSQDSLSSNKWVGHFAPHLAYGQRPRCPPGNKTNSAQTMPGGPDPMSQWS